MESGIDLVGRCCRADGVLVHRCLLGLAHCSPEGLINGTGPVEIGLHRLCRSSDGIRVLPALFLAHVNGPRLVNKTCVEFGRGSLDVVTGPVVDDALDTLLDCHAALGRRVDRSRASTRNRVQQRVIEEGRAEGHASSTRPPCCPRDGRPRAQQARRPRVLTEYA